MHSDDSAEDELCANSLTVSLFYNDTSDSNVCRLDMLLAKLAYGIYLRKWSGYTNSNYTKVPPHTHSHLTLTPRAHTPTSYSLPPHIHTYDYFNDHIIEVNIKISTNVTIYYPQEGVTGLYTLLHFLKKKFIF